MEDLYKITFEQFLEKNPEYSKQSKDIQLQRYNLYEEQRKQNIERCKSKRKEIIANTKKVKPTKKKKYDEESSDEELNIKIDDILDIKKRYQVRNTEDNYILRKNLSTKKQKQLAPKSRILETANSYILSNSNGKKSEITKEDLEKYKCIKDEKKKLEKKTETKDDHLMRYLKVELDRAQKIKKVKEKLNEKDKKLQKFIKIKNNGLKSIENGRYKDNQNIHERQKIFEKMISNYDQKIFLSKEQQKEKNLNKISMETSKKMEELNRQIQDYEKKNNEYKQKITNIFELKDKQEIEGKIKERLEKKEKTESPISKKESSSYLIKKKLNDYEEKFEIEKYRRENALITNMNKFQDKINTYLEENEKRENKIKNNLIKAEKEKEKLIKKNNEKFNKVQENIKNNKIEAETKRKKLMDEIEKKDLKDYAIKQEKKKMYEERRKMNKLNKEERDALKLKIQAIINNEDTIAEGEKNEEIFNKLMNESINNNKEK